LSLTLNNEIDHASTKHKDRSLKFLCTACNKQFIKIHAALCHLTKCPGRQIPPTDLKFTCTSCGKQYSTKSGLSQHERHMHPLVRNLARKTVAELVNNETTQPKLCGKVWTQEEINIMLRLEKELIDKRFIAKEMSPYLPLKTLKQIRDKRNEATYKRRSDELVASSQQAKEAKSLSDISLPTSMESAANDTPDIDNTTPTYSETVNNVAVVSNSSEIGWTFPDACCDILSTNNAEGERASSIDQADEVYPRRFLTQDTLDFENDKLWSRDLIKDTLANESSTTSHQKCRNL